MLFFIDETWQTVGGRQVAALGAVGMRQASYNRFCREVFAIKQNVLGAEELSDAELKGAKCFAKRAFRAREGEKGSKLLVAADGMLDALERHGARAFVIWTAHADLVGLRSTKTTELSPPYKQLLHDFRALMEQKAPRRLGSLNFDQRDLGSDEVAACALQNYLVRTRGINWDRHFLTVPNFTVSAVSPGLQAADLIAYLGAHYAPGSERPELEAYMKRVERLQLSWRDPAGRLHRTIRGVGTTTK
ncbi:MAG TPA: DUF3800 domain-containing protein [Solirubrobacteraceae bacterium]